MPESRAGLYRRGNGSEEQAVERNDPGGAGRGWQERLVDEAGRAAHAGWAQTARLIALIAAGAAAVALIVLASR
jgi:hypothetical protein